MDRKKLCAPFPREVVRTRPGQHGKQLTYVATPYIVERLNEAVDQWDFFVDEHQVHGSEVVVLGRLVADGITKTAFGGSSITLDRESKVASLGDDLKAAASDSLKKAASLLGVPIGGGHEQPGRSSAERPRQAAPPQQEQQPRQRRPSLGGATVRQLSAINSASRRCGFNQRQLGEFVQGEVGKNDISLLSKEEASALIDRLNAIPQNGHSHTH